MSLHPHWRHTVGMVRFREVLMAAETVKTRGDGSGACRIYTDISRRFVRVRGARDRTTLEPPAGRTVPGPAELE